METILILEDEPVYIRQLDRIVRSVFPRAELTIESSVPAILEKIPDLAILDIGLEGEKDGIQFGSMKNLVGFRVPDRPVS